MKKSNRIRDRTKLNLRVHNEDFHDKDFLFYRANGYPYITKTVLNRMDRLRQSTNIKKRTTPHIFRHTYIA
ncbi:tyrosine-type recombinase/integrase [Shouchella hunanensis]|uniref:tyrosine-type recombinase/integrase n=1 Tax=Shouchella hunanensis TaxID=766894 RepID=UPI003D81B10A